MMAITMTMTIGAVVSSPTYVVLETEDPRTIFYNGRASETTLSVAPLAGRSATENPRHNAELARDANGKY